MMDPIEENHAREINAMKDEHSNQMDSMRIEQITLQSKLQMMEKSQVQELQLRPKDPEGKHKELSTNHKPPSPIKQFLSHHVEVSCPLRNRLTKGARARKEIEKNQCIEINHSTCGVYVSPLTKYIQNKIGHASDTSNISSKHQGRKSTLVAS